MPTDTNIIALLTQSFSQPGAGNPVSLTDSTGQADFDQFLGQEFDRPVYEKEFTPRESFNDRVGADRSAEDRLSGVQENAQNDRAETPARTSAAPSDQPETPTEHTAKSSGPVEDAPASDSDTPVNNESENPQTASEPDATPAVESLEAEPSQALGDEIPNDLNSTEDQPLQVLRDRLEQLNIDPELIDILVASLADNPRANGFLQSLYGLLTATAQAGAGASSATGTAGLPENRVLQNLIRTGLSEVDAQKVIDQAVAALASKQAETKGGPATLPQTDGLKGNGIETSGEKLPAKAITQNLPLAQNNAETQSDSKNSSNANAGKLEKLASLLKSDANPLTQNASPFKLAVNAFLNLNGKTATPLNVTSAEGLAVQATTAADSAGKSAEVFKPVLAETYGQRGSAEKTVASQIIERISFRGMGSQKEINIKLDPPSLGSVRMNVSTSGESVRTTIVTENHFVKQVIEGNLSQLKDSLANQGIKVDHFSVLVGGNAEQNTAHQQESASPTQTLGLDNEDFQDTAEELVLTQGPVIFNESTINVFA